MKQRIRVIGIIEAAQGDVLLLRRHQPLAAEAPVWELPTGKIEFGEQPEEAMSRVLLEDIGVHAAEINLRDAVTMVLPAETGRENTLYVVYAVKLKTGEKVEPRGFYSAYKYIRRHEVNGLRVDEVTRMLLGMREMTQTGVTGQDGYRAAINGATVFVDGCSRGNPGPAGAGYYIVDESGQVLRRGGVFLGFATSRVAEYYALKEGCQQALELGLTSVRFVSDSLMLVNQMNGLYKVKNSDLLPIYRDIKEMLKDFEACAFVHVRRDQNTEADGEANAAVDEHFARKHKQ